ncbi:MAG: hypothetical protein ACQERX_03070 [Bacillota bacterium]
MKEKRYYKMSVKDYSTICPNAYWQQLYKQNNKRNSKYSLV